MTFANLPNMIKEAEDQIHDAHSHAATTTDDELSFWLQNEEEMRNIHLMLSNCLETFWKQRSRIQWLQGGDQNTMFFYTKASIHSRCNFVRQLQKQDGSWVQDQKEIAELLLQNFEDLYCSNPTIIDEDLFTCVQNRLNLHHIDSILKHVTRDDVKQALFSIGSEKAPGLDGFISMFYKKFWELTGDDIWWLVNHFFSETLNAIMVLEPPISKRQGSVALVPLRSAIGNLSQLPIDLILDITARLPAESILDCKLVHKPWRNLVCDDSSFSQLYLTYLLNHSTDSAGKLSFLVKDQDQQLHYFEYNENHDMKLTSTTSIKRFSYTSPFRYNRCDVIGSSNGLICLNGYPDDAYSTYNPLTREYVMLPKINRDHYYQSSSSGFGYLPLTNEYKVFDAYKLGKDLNTVEVKVYTLGSGIGWKDVGRFSDVGLHTTNARHGYFANGVLYWIDKHEGMIFFFNLTEEKFGESVVPHLLPSNSAQKWFNMGVLGGVLYYRIGYITTYNVIHTGIWLQKENNDTSGIKEQVNPNLLRWSEEFRFLGGQPLGITKSGGVLCVHDSSLIIYDPITSTTGNIVHFDTILQVSPQRNTLVSLKDLGEEDVKVIESAESKGQKARQSN